MLIALTHNEHMSVRASLFLMMILNLLYSADAAAAGCEKSVRWNDDPPFSMKGSEGQVIGIHVDQLRETLRRMGCTARLVEMPWARALTEVEAGRLDILPGAIRTAERDRYAWFATPGPQSNNVLFIQGEATRRWRFQKFSDLRGSGFRLGAQIGVSYGEEYNELMRDPDFARTVHHVSTRRSLWLMLSAGRIDGVVADVITGPTELAQMGLQDQIRSSGVIVHHSPATTMFSKHSIEPEFVERFNKASEAMIKDGSLNVILKRYGAAQ